MKVRSDVSAGKSAKYSLAHLAAINLFILLCLIVFFEALFFLSRAVLEKDNVGFLISPNTNSFARDLSDNCMRMKTHPFLSHVHDDKGLCKVDNAQVKRGFVNYDSLGEDDFSIITLGGSTTDGLMNYSKGRTWPKILQEKITSNGYRAQIRNGGVAGYGSSQELLKLTTASNDVLQNLKFVISLNGINEIKGVYGIPYHSISFKNFTENPYFTDTLSFMFQEQKWVLQNKKRTKVLPNIFSFIDWLSGQNAGASVKDFPLMNESGREFSFSPADLWERNIRALRKISQSYGAEYYVFLQPSMGVNRNQVPSDLNSSDGLIFSKINPSYIQNMTDFYKLLSSKCDKYDYCIDLSNTALPTGNLYYDYRHHNQFGNEVIAYNIMEHLKNDLSKNSTHN